MFGVGRKYGGRRWLSLALAFLLGGAASAWGESGEALPTGQRITPAAAPGAVFQSLDPGLPDYPQYRAGQAVAAVLSPDGATLLVLTSGFNRLANAAGGRARDASNEYVFVYDVSSGVPRQRRVLQLADTFQGIAWFADGNGFAVSGGVDDDVHLFERDGARFVERAPPIALGHKAGLGIATKPVAAGLAPSLDGRRLLVANYQNDSVSLGDVARRRVLAELDLRPGKLDPRQRGVAGGEFPLAVAWASPEKAYVASERDRELVVLRVAGDRLAVTGRIKLTGEPTALLLDRVRARLFVAEDDSDSVAIVDTAKDRIAAEFPVGAPRALLPNPQHLKGSGPNALALAPDERRLFVSLGGLNAVAVVGLAAAGGPQVEGLLPTGWYPTGVAVSRGGGHLFIVNGKSDPGPNPGGCRDTTARAAAALARCRARNGYVWQREHAGLLSLPVPDRAALERLSAQVAQNDNFGAAGWRGALMDLLRRRIRHVIYVVKENRSYDQVLGDLDRGNGDPRLTLLGASFTPNHHALARDFVTLDAFFDSGEVSSNGWLWSTAARSTDFMEKETPVNYAGRGLEYDSEGLNRGLNPAAPPAERRLADPDELPGPADVAAPDAADGTEGGGYLWDGALKAGLSLRNYGFFGDFTRYDPTRPDAIPLIRDPFAEKRRVFFATKRSLAPVSDPYYRAFDLRFPDFWRIHEWRRDFARLVAQKAVPRLMLVRLPNDHFGNFAAAIDGVDTVETQMADNDYALGLLVATVAKSPVAMDTLIFVVEDDAQNGADHVDAHRSIALVIGAYVKRGAVISERYTTVNLLRTIEDVLGLPPLGLNDALAEPMSAVFQARPAPWSYAARIAPVLRQTALPLPRRRAALPLRRCGSLPPRDEAYWQARLGDEDYRAEDRLDTARFNAALWQGRIGAAAPPAPDGRDLRRGRAALLAEWRTQQGCRD
jgi:DNA-binding beta-propeller fold protein YncE